MERNNKCNVGKKFTKCYDEDSNKGYIFEVGVEYPENLHDLHNDLLFMPERMKVNNCNNKKQKNENALHK